MATDASLRYLVEVNDRDLKELQRSVRDTNKLLGTGTSKASDEASGGLSRLGGAAGKVGKTVGVVGLALGGALAGGAAVAGKKMVDLASDAAEVDSKLNVVFGGHLPGVKNELDAFSAATGASRYELRQQAADMGALLGPMLGSKAAAGDMSTQFVKLATDLGSFNNIPTAEALEKIRAGLVGEAEPLRSLGVLINAATVEQEAYRLGIAKTGAELTEQQKVQARASLIMQQTTQAQGDATRTADSMSNQMKALRNNITDAATSLGQELIPIALQAVQAFNAHWPTIERVAKVVLGAVVAGIREVVDFVRRHWDTISDVMTTVFRAAKSAWENVLRPAIDAIIGAFGKAQEGAEQKWGGVRGAVQAVIGWFETNVVPTVRSIVGNVTGFWNDHREDIEKVLGLVQRVVGRAFAQIKDAVELVLAVLRGDWGRAWDELKSMARRAIENLVDVITTLGPIIARAALALGGKIIDGIIDGVKSGASRLGSAIGDMIGGVLPNIDVPGFSPVRDAGRKAIGDELMDGATDGVLAGKIKLLEALSEAAKEAVARAQSVLQSNMGRLQGYLGRAFQVRQGAAETKTEKRIREMEEQRELDRLTTARAEAYDAMVAAEAEGGEKLAAAQEAFREAQYQHELFFLQRQADEERKQLEARQYVEQQNFDKRLASLQEYLESGHATAAGARARILDLMHDFGLDLGDVGELVGRAFAQGLRDAIPDAVDAARELTESVKQEKVITKKLAGAQARKEAVEKAKAAAAERAKAAVGLGGGSKVATSGGSTLETLLSFAKAQGITVTSTTGGKHTAGSFHYQGRAIDVAGSHGAMRSFFLNAIATFGTGRIKELFYDPMGYYIDEGRRIAGAIGGHGGHVHLALERGGIVTGPTLAEIGERRRSNPEAVLPLGSSYGQRVLVDAFASALGRVSPGGGSLLHADTLIVRDDHDIERIGAKLAQAQAVRG